MPNMIGRLLEKVWQPHLKNTRDAVTPKASVECEMYIWDLRGALRITDDIQEAIWHDAFLKMNGEKYRETF